MIIFYIYEFILVIILASFLNTLLGEEISFLFSCILSEVIFSYLRARYKESIKGETEKKSL